MSSGIAYARYVVGAVPAAAPPTVAVAVALPSAAFSLPPSAKPMVYLRGVKGRAKHSVVARKRSVRDDVAGGDGKRK
jgi:hypothetical protein